MSAEPTATASRDNRCLECERSGKEAPCRTCERSALQAQIRWLQAKASLCDQMAEALRNMTRAHRRLREAKPGTFAEAEWSVELDKAADCARAALAKVKG